MELSSNVRSKSFVGLTELLIVAGLMLCLGCRNNDKQSDKTTKEVAKHATSFAKHAFKLDVSTVEGGLKIGIRENDKTVQTINYRYPEDYEAYSDMRETKYTLQDANFDGHKDLLIPLGLFGNQQLSRYDCYVWDNAKAKFIHSPSFIEIANPTICIKQKCIFSSERSSAAEYVYHRWEYKKDKFVATAILYETYTAPDAPPTYTEEFPVKQQQRRNLKREDISGFWEDILR